MKSGCSNFSTAAPTQPASSGVEPRPGKGKSIMRTLMVTVLALGLMAISASAVRADTFACVNNNSGTPKIVASCTVGTNASPCHNNDTCTDLSLSGQSLTLAEVCSPANGVAADGFFNIDVTCPAGDVVVTGGYSCSDLIAPSGILEVAVSVNTFFGFPGLTGWQTIGQNLSEDVGTCQVCISCTPGTTLPL